MGYWIGTGKESNVFDIVELTGRAGIDVVEILPAKVLELSSSERKELKKTLSDKDMYLSINGGLNETNDISADDSAIRKAGIEFCKNVIEAATEAGGAIWSGVNFSAFRRRPEEIMDIDEKNRIRDLSIESMRSIIKTAEDLNFLYCFEVVNRYEQFLFNAVDEAVAFAKMVQSPNAKLLIDAFHMNIEEDSITDAIEYVAKHDKLGHFHVGESNRRIPGNGKSHMPWEDIFSTLKKVDYKGFITMEPFVLMGNRAALSVSVWRDLSNDADLDKMVYDVREGAKFVRSFL